MDSVPPLEVVTIQKGFNIPPPQKCTDCCDGRSFHCPFCLPMFFQPSTYSRAKIHLVGHLKRAVYVGEYTIHRCALECRKGTHYHCPFCSTTRIRRETFTNHLSKEHRKRARKTSRYIQETRGQTEGSSSTSGEDDLESDDNSDDEDDRETISSDSEDKNSQGASSSGSSGSSSQLQTVPEKTRDCDDQYFMSLVKLFKKLSSQKKADVRLKIERLLLEAEFQ